MPNKFEQLRDRLAEIMSRQQEDAYKAFDVGKRPYDSVNIGKDEIWDLYSTAAPDKRQQLWDSWDQPTKKQFRKDFAGLLEDQGA